MGDYLANMDEETRMRMAVEDPRTLPDDELRKRAYGSLRGDTRRDKIIDNALAEIARRRAADLQRRATEAAETSARRLWWLTWWLVIPTWLLVVLTVIQAWPQLRTILQTIRGLLTRP